MTCDNVRVVKNVRVSKDIYEIVIECPEKIVKPGQFFMVKLIDSDAFLGRPLSVFDRKDGRISLLYAVVGKGTTYLSKLEQNDLVQFVGPLGNGFDIDILKGKIALVSGGIGIAPFLYLAKTIISDSCDLYAGFKDDVYAVDEISNYVDAVKISTETGSVGHKGYVTEIFDPSQYDIVITCGPSMMMEIVVDMCKKTNTKVFISSENRMICGMGACRACSCKTTDGMKRSCMEGPVFNGEELIFNA